MTLPTQKHRPQTYSTLEDIRLRKDELLDEIDQSSKQFSGLWGSLFVKREESTRGEYISSMITHGITAVDTIILVRKLIKNYRGLFRRGGKRR